MLLYQNDEDCGVCQCEGPCQRWLHAWYVAHVNRENAVHVTHELGVWGKFIPARTRILDTTIATGITL